MSRGVTNMPFAASSSQKAEASTTVGTPSASTGTASVSRENGRPVVADAGAGHDARVAELHGGAEAVERGGGEGVDGYDLRGPDALAGGFYQLRALYPGRAQDAGAYTADGGEAGDGLGHGCLEMPRGQHVLQRQRPDGVGRHRRVAEARPPRQV